MGPGPQLPGIANDPAGAGGGLRYIQEIPTSRMVNQEHGDACVIACVRQLLWDAGQEYSEAELRGRIGVLPGFGSALEPAAEVLSALHPRLVYDWGGVDPAKVEVLLGRDLWVARVKTLTGRYHAIIVDGRKSDLVCVRDPWGLDGPGSGRGTEAEPSLEHFLEHWLYGTHHGIFPVGLKGQRQP